MSRKESITIEERTSEQLLACVAILLGNFCIGMALSWCCPVLPQLQGPPRHFSATEDAESWITSLLLLGAVFGGPFAIILLNAVGSRKTLIISAGAMLFGWLVICVAHAIEMIYLGRLITGFSIGVICLSGPTYVHECTVARIQHALAHCSQLMIGMGVLFTHAVGIVTRWDWLSLVCVLTSLLLAVSITQLPESPLFLLRKGEVGEARYALRRLKSQDYDLDKDLSLLQQHVEVLRRQSTSSLVDGPVVQTIFVAVGLLLLQQMSGVVVVLMQAERILRTMSGPLAPNMAAVVLGGAIVATSLVSLVTPRCTKRSLVTAASFVVMAAGMGALGFFFRNREDGFLDDVQWLPQASLLVYTLAFSSGILSVPWGFLAESVPEHLQEKVFACTAAVFWAAAFVVTKSYMHLYLLMGSGLLFWVCGAFCICGALFAILVLPDEAEVVDDEQVFFANEQTDN